MTVEVKKLGLKKSGKERAIQVTIEDIGTKKEYCFDIEPEEAMDENTFRSILNMWSNHIIPQQEARAKLKDSEIENILKKRIGSKNK